MAKYEVLNIIERILSCIYYATAKSWHIKLCSTSTRLQCKPNGTLSRINRLPLLTNDQEQPLLLEDLLEQEKREQERQQMGGVVQGVDPNQQQNMEQVSYP